MCYCDNCAEAFRIWLQERYQSLEEVNTAYGKSVYFLLNHTEQVQHVTLPGGNFVSLLDGKSVAGQVEVGAVDVVILLG